MTAEELQGLNGMLRGGAIDFLAPPEEVRAVFAGMLASLPSDPTLVTEERTIGGVPGIWLASDSDHIILHIHGGGFSIGSAAAYLNLSSSIAKSAGVGLFSIDYRLAPEHRYPAATDDALAAYQGLLDLGYTGDRISIVGDSAGGAISLALMLFIRDLGLPRPANAVLLSPFVDLTLSGNSHTTKRSIDVSFTTEQLAGAVQHYTAGNTELRYASPIDADLSGLPPLLIETGEAEILLSDSLTLAARAAEAGVDTRLHVWPGLPHVWALFAAVLSEGRDVIAEAGDFIAGR
jgi:epsilon-lactone hydrolase